MKQNHYWVEKTDRGFAVVSQLSKKEKKIHAVKATEVEAEEFAADCNVMLANWRRAVR